MLRRWVTLGRVRKFTLNFVRSAPNLSARAPFCWRLSRVIERVRFMRIYDSFGGQCDLWRRWMLNCYRFYGSVALLRALSAEIAPNPITRYRSSMSDRNWHGRGAWAKSWSCWGTRADDGFIPQWCRWDFSRPRGPIPRGNCVLLSSIVNSFLFAFSNFLSKTNSLIVLHFPVVI